MDFPCRSRPCENLNRRSSGSCGSRAEKDMIERKIGRQIRLFEQKRDGIGKKIETNRSGSSSSSAAYGSTTKCASSAPGSSGRCRPAR